MADAKRVEKYKRHLYSRVPLVGGWLRRKAADTFIQDGSPEAVQVLEEAAAGSGHEHVSIIALEALQQLGSQGCIEAREALCRLVVEYDHPLAREVAISRQYAPRDPQQRALFYFLTEQWDKYEEVDFDQALLRTIYEVGEAKLQQRIAEKARRAGRVAWVEVVTGGRQRRRLGTMTDAEWEAVLAVLSRRGQWEELWRLAQLAPAVWSVRYIRRLASVGWVPTGVGERSGFTEVVRLAAACEGKAPAFPLVRSRAMLECRGNLNGGFTCFTCLVVSPDGQLLVSGISDNTVRLWRLPAGEALQTLEGHTDEIKCLAVSPDGQLLVSGEMEGGRVRLWRLPAGEALRTLEGHTGGVVCLAMSPDGRLLVSGGGEWDKTVRLWRLPEGEALRTLKGHTAWVACLAVSPDGQLLASGSLDQTVRLWRLPEGKAWRTLKGHTAWVACLAVSPDGQLLASGGGWDKTMPDQTIRLWRLPEGKAWRTLEGHTGGVWCLAISPDGRLLASGGDDGTVRLWRLPEGKAWRTLKGHTSSVWRLAISPDGRLLASGSLDKTVRLWQLPEGEALRTLEGHTSGVEYLSMSPDGRQLASGGRWDYTVCLWRLEPFMFNSLPLGQTTVEDMAWVQEELQRQEASDAERRWLEFLLAMMRWRRRFDIGMGEAPKQIAVGEFDIEIEG